jgi:cytochrome b subunit of formate dehydrogenase
MSTSEKRYNRFNLPQRIEHFVLIISFSLLGLTGIPQKYASAGISEWVFAVLGGIETVRVIHRISATIFVLQSVYHFILVGYKLFVLRKSATMLPGLKDLIDAIQSFGYNLGFVKKAPKMPRYNFTEKAEYLAMLWGLFLMALTGFMLWNPIATVSLLPGEFIPAAKAAHGGEAVLAVLAIILWHFYNVHIKHWNWAMFKGYLTREQMHEEHGQELEEIEAGKVDPMVSPLEIRRRTFIFAPIAGVIALAGTFAVFLFVTFEQTAITTLPPAERAEVFVPQTPTPIPPTATPRPTIIARPMDPNGSLGPATTWDGGIGALITERCGACHGLSGGLGLKDYASLVAGGEEGAVFIAGDADNSLLVNKVKDGAHPGTFTAEELKTVEDWITAGAPEN